MLRQDVRHFVAIDSNRWRLRSPYACSFCLCENSLPYGNNRDYPSCSQHFICLDCAKKAVGVLSTIKAADERQAANETAIMTCESGMIGG